MGRLGLLNVLIVICLISLGLSYEPKIYGIVRNIPLIMFLTSYWDYIEIRPIFIELQNITKIYYYTGPLPIIK